jgi:Xaa-Pro aminopeptidase
MNLFDTSIYQQRRDALSKAMGKGILLFPGAVEQPFNYKANTYPFRQDSSFLYYFGWAEPGLTGIIDADSGRSYLVGDDLSLDDIVWMGNQPTMADKAGRIGADQVMVTGALKSFVQGKEVHYLPPYHADRLIWLSELLDKSLSEIRNGHSMQLVRAVIEQRAHKSAEEIEQMEDALTITKVIHDKMRTMISPGKEEARMRGIAEGIAMAHHGRLSYQAICTIMGHVLHNNQYHRMMKAGDMLLCDLGAENRMSYAGDITRSYPVSPTFTTQQAEIYDIELEAQIKSIEAIKPGVPYRDIHLGAARIITEGLKQLGLMKGDTDEAVAAGAHALFFPHGLGHMIGLDVHDMEGLGEEYVGYDDHYRRSDQFGTAYLRMARPLEPGFVMTVEPGIYFIPELIDQWQAAGRHSEFIQYDRLADYRNFTGIRIEDNVLVTEDGYRVLGPPIAKERKEVER